MSDWKGMKGTGFFDELTNFASLSSVWIVNISCEQLWADHDWAESWVSSAGPARPRCPGALYSSPAQCHEPLPSFLLQPVTMSQAVDKNSNNWLDVKETFTARVGTVNEYILAPVVETIEHLYWRIAATYLGQTSKLWNVQFVILSKQCENLQTKAPPLSDASTVQSAGRRRRWWMVEPWVGEGPFSDVG